MKNSKTGLLETGSMLVMTLLPLLLIFWDQSKVSIISRDHIFLLLMLCQTLLLVLSTGLLVTTISLKFNTVSREEMVLFIKLNMHSMISNT